jgi:hypothetical protein
MCHARRAAVLLRIRYAGALAASAPRRELSKRGDVGAWSPYAGAIAVAPTNQRFIQLFSDGQALNEARWPNADPADLVHMPRASAGFGTDPTGVVLTGAPAGDWTGGWSS